VIVVDASALINALLAASANAGLAARLFLPGESWHAPHLIDLECSQVLRRMNRAGSLTPSRALQAIGDLDNLRMTRYGHEPFLLRIWELRHAITAYDAAYVALAEALNAPLVTCDRWLAASHGHHAKIEVYP